MKLPTEQQCLEYFNKYKTPKNIQEHCIKVRDFAIELGKKIKDKGEEINLEFVNVFGLMHDLFKIVSLKNPKPNRFHPHPFSEEELFSRDKLLQKYPNLHEAEIAYEIFKDDYPELALSLKNTIQLGKEKRIEEDLVHYADWRVLGNEVVSLQERFDYLYEIFPGKEHRKFIDRDIAEMKLFEESLKKRGLTFN